MDTWKTSKSYYPELGRVNPDGELRVPVAGRSEDGLIWDGYETIDQNHPNYAEWLELAKNSDKYLAAKKEERKKARAERRARNKEKRATET